jgi:hypothetical protein
MRADMKELELRGLLLPADKDAALGRIALVESHDECVRAQVVVEVSVDVRGRAWASVPGLRS